MHKIQVQYVLYFISWHLCGTTTQLEKERIRHIKMCDIRLYFYLGFLEIICTIAADLECFLCLTQSLIRRTWQYPGQHFQICLPVDRQAKIWFKLSQCCDFSESKSSDRSLLTSAWYHLSKITSYPPFKDTGQLCLTVFVIGRLCDYWWLVVALQSSWCGSESSFTTWWARKYWEAVFSWRKIIVPIQGNLAHHF